MLNYWHAGNKNTGVIMQTVLAVTDYYLDRNDIPLFIKTAIKFHLDSSLEWVRPWVHGMLQTKPLALVTDLVTISLILLRALKVDCALKKLF